MTHTLDSIMALADRMYSAPAGTLKDMIEGELRLAVSEVLAERDRAVGRSEYWKAEHLAANAECERLRKGGCARDQGLTQYCAEAAGLAQEAAEAAEERGFENGKARQWLPTDQLIARLRSLASELDADDSPEQIHPGVAICSQAADMLEAFRLQRDLDGPAWERHVERMRLAEDEVQRLKAAPPAVQVEPVGKVVAAVRSANDPAMIQWTSDYRPKVGDLIYAAPPAVQVDTNTPPAAAVTGTGGKPAMVPKSMGKPPAEQQVEPVAWQKVAAEALAAWDSDQDSRVGKLLRAMADPEFARQYRADIAALHAAPPADDETVRLLKRAKRERAKELVERLDTWPEGCQPQGITGLVRSAAALLREAYL